SCATLAFAFLFIVVAPRSTTRIVSRSGFLLFFFFFFNDTATTEIYTLSLHDALPISDPGLPGAQGRAPAATSVRLARDREPVGRSEEHTSELQSRSDLVCRLLLEKKKK